MENIDRFSFVKTAGLGSAMIGLSGGISALGIIVNKLVSRKGVLLVLALILIAFNQALSQVELGTNSIYFVDNVNGNDRNSGTNEKSAWRTLLKVNNTQFQPGDIIKFKKGGRWDGQLWPKGSGSKNNPIIIDMYGPGSNKPVIDGNGITGTGVVYLYNQEYWVISNLEIVNDAEIEGDRKAVFIHAENFGVVNNIHIKDMFIHDIKGLRNGAAGDWAGKLTGGIIFVAGPRKASDKSIPTRFNNVLIESNTIVDCNRSGIWAGTSSWAFGYPSNFWTNVIIRNNTVTNVGGDGIVSLFSQSPLIENNVVNGFQTDTDQYAAGIWTWYTQDAIVQYNESCNGVFPGNDGQGFDLDGYNKRNIYQYNYSHDNAGGFMLICVKGHEDNIVRYNISQNDGRAVFVLLDEYVLNGLKIYNNTIYIGQGMDTKLTNRSGKLGKNEKAPEFKNNIVFNTGNATGNFGAPWIIENNLLYGNNSGMEDPNKITANPEFENGGKAGVGRLSIKAAYALKPNSPAINSGMKILNCGDKDFIGKIIPYDDHYDLGALEFQTP
jgi:hypothetical protein